MANIFEFIGKIVPCKETESFKPYNVQKFDSGWVKTSIRFNVVCNTNRHFLEVSVLTPPNINTATIYTYERGEKKEDGTQGEGKNIQVSYADRLKPEIVSKVAHFKKFIVDTELPNRRNTLQNAVDKFKEGNITDEEIEKLGIGTLEACEAALSTSKKKRHEYIWEYDFIEYLNKFVNNDAIKDMIFKIKGTYELEYNADKGQWYRKLKPTSIYRCNDNDEAKSYAEFNIVFDKNAVDDSDFEETGKIHINGYIGQYLGKPYKAVKYAPTTFNLVTTKGDEKSVKFAKAMAKRFTFPDDYEGEYRECGVKTAMLDGAQIVELTEDMLSEAQREALDMGLCTMDDIRKELDKPVYGDRVQDIVITGLCAGYTNGSKETILTEDDVKYVRTNFGEIKDEDLELPFEEDDDDII